MSDFDNQKNDSCTEENNQYGQDHSLHICFPLWHFYKKDRLIRLYILTLSCLRSGAVFTKRLGHILDLK